jgi:hypothetical protein
MKSTEKALALRAVPHMSHCAAKALLSEKLVIDTAKETRQPTWLEPQMGVITPVARPLHYTIPHAQGDRVKAFMLI